MRRPVLIATTAVGAALAAGLIAVPALAGTGAPAAGSTATPTPSVSATYPCDGTGASAPDWAGGPGRQNGSGAQGGNGAGNGPGNGMGNRAGNGRGNGPGAGAGQSADPLAGLSQGTLTADQKAKLAAMAEEEKLAHDVYVVLAERTGDARFTRIAASEARHVTEVRALLTRYGIADPTAGKAEGEFASAEVKALYQDLVARGSVSLDAALAVGRDIENLDLKDLATAQTGVSAQDVTTVYTRLANGSRMHLRAFGG